MMKVAPFLLVTFVLAVSGYLPPNRLGGWPMRPHHYSIPRFVYPSYPHYIVDERSFDEHPGFADSDSFGLEDGGWPISPNAYEPRANAIARPVPIPSNNRALLQQQQQQQQRLFFNAIFNTTYNPFTNLVKTVTSTLTSTIITATLTTCIPSNQFVSGTSPTSTCARRRRAAYTNEFLDESSDDFDVYQAAIISPSKVNPIEPTEFAPLNGQRENVVSSKDELLEGSQPRRGRAFINLFTSTTTTVVYSFNSTVIKKTIIPATIVAPATTGGLTCLPSGWIVC